MFLSLTVLNLPSVEYGIFLNFFVEKVNNTRAQITPAALDPLVTVPCSAAYYQFAPVTFFLFNEVVSHLKPSGSPTDVVSTGLFNKVIATLGPSGLGIINTSFLSGIFPKILRYATVQALPKKTIVDPSFRFL